MMSGELSRLSSRRAPFSATRSSEIRSLTGIRGVAAIMVVLYHYFQDSKGTPLLHAAVFHGYIGVDLFFVLSGFVIALNYAKTFDTFSSRAYLEFLGKRLARVYPLYLLMTLLAAAFMWGGLTARPAPSAAELGSNLLMVQTWGLADSIDAPAWSISTEWAAYLMFPLMVHLVLTRRALCAAASCVALAAVVILSSMSAAELNQVAGGHILRSGPMDITGLGTPYPLLRCLASFVMGMTATRLAVRARAGAAGNWRYAGDVTFAVVLLLWITPGTDVLLIAAFVALVVALSFERSLTARVLATPVIYWLGEISYSIYLVHVPIENLVRRPLKAQLNLHHIPHAYSLAGVVPLVITLLVATLTFYTVEKPARRAVRSLTHLRLVPIQTEPAAPLTPYAG